MVRSRSHYRSNAGQEAARKHIEEAREFTRELGGTDKDVKEYFFSMSREGLNSLFLDYGKKYGDRAESYARETLQKWKSGKTQMSGLVCKRLFNLLPPRMPLKKKYELAENIWKHFGPTSSDSYRIGPNVNVQEVQSVISSKLDETITEYLIPETVRNRFNWLSSGDIHFKEQLLNHFRTQEKNLILDRISLELPVLLKQSKEYAETSGRVRSVLKIQKHEISLLVDNSLDDEIKEGSLYISPSPSVRPNNALKPDNGFSSIIIWIIVITTVLFLLNL